MGSDKKWVSKYDKSVKYYIWGLEITGICPKNMYQEYLGITHDIHRHPNIVNSEFANISIY